VVEQLPDVRRNLRTLLGIFVLLIVGLFALFPTIVLGYHVLVVADEVTDRNQQLLTYQAIADVPFTIGAVLAFLSMRTLVPTTSWRLLAWSFTAVAVGFGLLFLNASTAPAP
jgi:hypothetical protein